MSIKFNMKGSAKGVALDAKEIAKQQQVEKHLNGEKKKPITSDELNKMFPRW